MVATDFWGNSAQSVHVQASSAHMQQGHGDYSGCKLHLDLRVLVSLEMKCRYIPLINVLKALSREKKR